MEPLILKPLKPRLFLGATARSIKLCLRFAMMPIRLSKKCMLAANVCAARFLEKHGVPGLYRVHEGPTLEKRLNLNMFLGSLGRVGSTGQN